ncbi:hypothetical protein [Poseidonibacter ostreae]|uniref:Uncharacterized protein n=1 Tax=Poseidonibacter ostreae TaxID=2654171 RepID=A0A6L4WMX0_9BACT|nr:hypothetical protein [Poseidonibacter ostreae]KAB7881225.1 hypothetical protein GA417_14215 [Poseidonibacter ostreae]KAB7884233.1 hypothetical protein GBG19_16060 [Poseidonibacter ostreae]KAB7886344.1 hypothetical protein GBG18_14695 [Poseidonibacter ostreae]
MKILKYTYQIKYRGIDKGYSSSFLGNLEAKYNDPKDNVPRIKKCKKSCILFVNYILKYICVNYNSKI